MYSSDSSGIDTDHDVRSQECKLVAVIPDKAQYNSKEKLALIFNNTLSDKGSYHVEFKGRKRSKIDVQACKVNSATLIVETPIYYPVERVKIHVRHRTYEGSTIIGTMPFMFLSRDEILAEVLRDYTGDPVTFMCESLGISPSDISSLDDALAVTFKRNMPKGFNLLGLHNDSIQDEATNSLHPTLLHFAAAFGLASLTKDCLLQCPGVTEASKVRNRKGMKPNEIAQNGGYEDLADEILRYQAQQEEGIYESMEKEEDPEYTQMAAGYINVQLWHQPSFEGDLGEKHEDQFYEAMTHCDGAEDDNDHGYVDAVGPDVHNDEELYMDMEKPNTNDDSEHYSDVTREEDQELYENFTSAPEDTYHGEDSQELYEAMVGDTGLGDNDQPEGVYKADQNDDNPTYDHPSNLPISLYPPGRSASVSQTYGQVRKLRNKRAPALPSMDSLPKVPPRTTSSSEETSPRERLSSTGSKISDVSNLSAASGTSTSSTSSGGHDGDVEEEHDDENFCMSREELLLQLKGKQKEQQKGRGPPAKTMTSRSDPPRATLDTYGGTPLPPVPPTDYEPQTSPPPVPTRVTGARSPRPSRQDRPKTTPVKTVDVQSAQKSNQSGSRSFKQMQSDTRQAYNRPTVTPEQRRNSSDSIGRAAAPFPVGGRPPAPVPKEPISESRRGVPTPLVLAMDRRDEAPPTPSRGTSAAQPQGPPKLLPRPAPRKLR